MKSIKAKIITIILAIIVLLCLALGSLGCFLNFRASENVVEETLAETAEVAADRIHYEIQAYKNIAIETGSIARLASEETSLAQKQAIIDQRANSHEFQRGNIIGRDGIGIFDGQDYSDRSYFKESMEGKTSISEPIISKKSGKLTIIISAPLWEGGIPDTEVIGVVYFVPTETFLNDIVASIDVGKEGETYILNSEGTTIASKNMKKVCVENTQKDVKAEPSLKSLAALEKKMIEGKKGSGSYSWEGEKEILAYAPISDTAGWSVGVCAVRNEFIGEAIKSIYFTIGIAILFMIAGLMVAIKFANRIANPIKLCAERMLLLSEGDLETTVPETLSKDETGILTDSMRTLVEELKSSIGDVAYHLGEMGNGNFSLYIEKEYKGDFSDLKTSMEQIIASLNDVLSQIVEGSEQVASGSDQVSSGAQALSQGATEQASSIEELSATITEITSQVKENAKNAQQASEMANITGREVQESNEKMQQLVHAMNDISDKSGEIGKIIKSIEDIAFQTNILALNAAVEAARAGEAGKGFAVVADEVRNLAAKSAEAAKNTTALIEDSLQAVEKGTQITGGTVETMLSLVESTKDAVVMIDKISEASKSQAESISQVTMGIDQISSVIQTNSATAEESAAASEELSSQAQIQKDMAEKFLLR